MTRAAIVARFVTDFLERVPVWLDCKVLVRPTPASRPRVSKWGTYYTGSYAAFLKAAPEAFREAFEGIRADGGPVCLAIELVAQRPKTTVRLTPAGDVDNHAKSVLDVLQKVSFLTNDELVDVLVVSKRWTNDEDEEPGIRVAGFKLDADRGTAAGDTPGVAGQPAEASAAG